MEKDQVIKELERYAEFIKSVQANPIEHLVTVDAGISNYIHLNEIGFRSLFTEYQVKERNSIGHEYQLKVKISGVDVICLTNNT